MFGEGVAHSSILQQFLVQYHPIYLDKGGQK